MSQQIETLPSSTSPTPLSESTVVGPATRSSSLVGAIRWDAWVGELPTWGDASSDNRTGLVVERCLSPAKWHYRLPFYAVEMGTSRVQIRATTQEVMDQEIAYARNAGLNYWAFFYYPPGSGLDTARNLYYSSQHNADIRYCLIFEKLAYLKDALSQDHLVDCFGKTEYQKVLDGRPLLYLLNIPGTANDDVTANRDIINAVRVDAAKAGIPNPYIVTMGGFTQLKVYGLDAISAYAESGSGGVSFAQLARAAERHWDSYRPTRAKIIPWVSAGWDPRPRIEQPVPWITYRGDDWSQLPKPVEIAQHLRNALTWNASHPDAGEANAVIIYAWNEFDEGGWICPTLRNGTDRLDAIAAILHKE